MSVGENSSIGEEKIRSRFSKGKSKRSRGSRHWQGGKHVRGVHAGIVVWPGGWLRPCGAELLTNSNFGLLG